MEIAGAILARSFERAEVSAQNMTNMTTPGYRALRSVSFEQSGSDSKSAGQKGVSVDLSLGQLQNTGNPFDLAISGQGFFVLRSATQTFYTRDGQFVRGSDGAIETADGLTLQSASGGDIVVSTNNPQVLSDGTVLVGGEPVARVATVDISDPDALVPAGSGLFTASSDAVTDANGQVRQGMLETSNVSTAAEMISIMGALRSAESGQKIVQVYDDLLARALNAFGSS